MNLASRFLLTVLMLGSSLTVAERGAHAAQKPGAILSEVPQQVDPKAHYLIYLSGYIVAAGNTRPVSPRFGVYEYDQILDTFKQSGVIVVSEARKQDREIEPYAGKVAEQVRQLLKAGVPARQITVVGASQGYMVFVVGFSYLSNNI